MTRNLIARLAVASVAIPIILWICYQGGYWLAGMVSLFAVVALGEFLSNEDCTVKSIHFWLALLSLSVVLLSLFISVGTGEMLASTDVLIVAIIPALCILAFFVLSSMIHAIGKLPPDELFTSSSRLTWGLVYIAGLYPFVFLLGAMAEHQYGIGPSGGDFLLFLFGLLWVGDTAAMGIGKWLGKHKLAPAVSPNKTVEGFIGGIVGAVAIGVLMIFWKMHSLPWYHVLVLAVGCSVFGQLGDLVESMWKRSLGIKDSSVIIPGHGGVLDRFDSLLFAAPFMFFYLFILSL